MPALIRQRRLLQRLKPMKTVQKIILFFSIFIFFFFLPISAFAVETGTMGIYPAFWDKSDLKTKSWFIYQLDKGETKEDAVTVINNSDEILNLKIYPVDAKTTADGAFSPLMEDEPKEGVGAWIRLPFSELTLKPLEKKEIKFSITVPADAPVGEHAGAIIIESKKVSSINQAGVGLNIKERVGVRVYETVPGEKVVKLFLKDLSFRKIGGIYTFVFQLKNEGNIILYPKTDIFIKQLWGAKIKTLENQSLGAIFPGKETSAQIRWEEAPQFAVARAQTSIFFADQKIVKSTWVIILPWWLVIPVLTGIFLFGFWKLKHLAHHHQKFKELMKISEQELKEEIEDHHHKTVIAIIISTTIILGLLGILALYKVITTWQFRQKIVNPTSRIEVVPTVSPTLTPIILTSEQKKNFQLVILNASGVRFSAAKTKEFLENKGYRVKKIGNWETEREKTLVSFSKESFASASAAIVYDLKEMYASPEAKYDQTQKEEIIIFIGKDKK